MSSLMIFAKTNVPKICKYSLAHKIHTSSALRSIKDYYEVLRVPKTATQAEIKESYYKLSKVYHPDIKKDDSSLNMFRTITEAYDVLGNIKAREEYDREKFSQKEMVDTSKTSFYVALHKESLKYGAAGTPDYEKIFAKRSRRDEYLREEEKDRHMEVQMQQKKSYEHQLPHLGDYGTQRMFIVIVYGIFIKYSVDIAEDYLGWGLPDGYVEDWEYATD